MTPEQKERIRAAAHELGAALTAVGDDFDTDVRQYEVTSFSDTRRRYAYSLHINATSREVIA